MTTHFLLYYSTCKHNDIRSIQKESCNSLYDRKEYMPSAKSIIAIERPRHNRLNLQKKIIDRCCNPKNHTHTHTQNHARAVHTHSGRTDVHNENHTHSHTDIQTQAHTHSEVRARAHNARERITHSNTREARSNRARAHQKQRESHARATETTIIPCTHIHTEATRITRAQNKTK